MGSIAGVVWKGSTGTVLHCQWHGLFFCGRSFLWTGVLRQSVSIPALCHSRCCHLRMVVFAVSVMAYVARVVHERRCQ